MKSITFLLVMTGMFQMVNAQSKWHKSLNFGLNHSISDTKIVPYDKDYDGATLASAKGVGFSLAGQIRRDVFQGLSVGVGVALNSIKLNKDESLKSLPVYITANYNILEGKNYPFVFADYGYALPYTNTLNRGRYMGFGAGYVFNQHLKVMVQTLHQNSEDTSYVNDRGGLNIRGGRSKFNNIALKIGWEF